MNLISIEISFDETLFKLIDVNQQVFLKYYQSRETNYKCLNFLFTEVRKND